MHWFRIAPLFSLLVMLMPAGCAVSGGGAPLPVVEEVDISRYMGRWYEIAKYPNSFEQGCFGVTADYSLREDGTVSVVNTCRSEDGTQVTRTIEGFATVADKATSAKLTVYFFFPFGAPYWIIDLGPDYEYALVGEPGRRFLWILSRTPVMDSAVYSAITQKLPALGYDPARLEIMKQFPEDGP